MLNGIADAMLARRHFNKRTRWILIKVVQNERFSIYILRSKSFLSHCSQSTFAEMRQITNRSNFHALKSHSAWIWTTNDSFAILDNY
jgi:hypothetical protein